MNKKSLYEFFNGKISKTVITKSDLEWVVKGRWSIISVWEDGLIDIWLCDTENLPLGRLGERKLSNIIRGLEKSAGKLMFHRLTGEAYTQTLDKDVVLLNLGLLGVRKKKQISSNNYDLSNFHLKKAS